jgi:hypothetical protein
MVRYYHTLCNSLLSKLQVVAVRANVTRQEQLSTRMAVGGSSLCVVGTPGAMERYLTQKSDSPNAYVTRHKYYCDSPKVNLILMIIAVCTSLRTVCYRCLVVAVQQCVMCDDLRASDSVSSDRSALFTAVVKHTDDKVPATTALHALDHR